MKNNPENTTPFFKQAFPNKLIVTVFLVGFFPLISGAFQVEKFTSARLKKQVDVVKGEIIVKFKPGTAKASKLSMAGKINALSKHELSQAGAEVIKLSGGMSVESGVNYYKNLPEVEYAEPNYIRHAFVTPNDTLYPLYQWGVARIDCPSAWDIIKASWNVTVAVIDTGVDYTHPDLYADVDWQNGYNFISTGTPPMDDNGHGTHVSGIISAMTNNNQGVAGVSWGAKILPVKVLDNTGSGSTDSIAEGVPYAVSKGAKVINLSLGGPDVSITEQTVIQNAHDQGVIIVAASGNNAADGDPTNDYVMYPAALPTVIAVGAMGEDNQRASFSNYGPELAVVAPGVDIWSTVPSANLGDHNDYLWSASSYASSDGTSMAAPFVSGVVALLLAKDPTLAFSDIYEKLTSTAIDIAPAGKDNYTGYGLVDAAAALGYKIPVVGPSLSASSTPNPFNPTNGGIARIYLSQSLKGSSLVVTIYNIAGEKVRTINSSFLNRAEWDGRNDAGNIVSAGMYYYVVQTNTGKAKGKITLIK